MNKKECTSCKFFDASLDGTRGINNRKLTGCTNAYGPHFFQGEMTCSLWSEKEEAKKLYKKDSHDNWVLMTEAEAEAKKRTDKKLLAILYPEFAE
jgi:hypothetical protein